MERADHQKIKKEAKGILDKFANALAKVEKEKDADVSEIYVDREESERNEGEKKQGKDEKCDSKDFKKRILENAPESNEDFILVERGDWK